MLIGTLVLSLTLSSKGCGYNERHLECLATKKALIFGISGQDGFYLGDLLLRKNYEVHGVGRSQFLPSSHAAISERVVFHQGDITDDKWVMMLIDTVGPDEIYNLSAQSSVATSFAEPWQTVSINTVGVLNILEGMRIGKKKNVKFFQAGSSELYGNAAESPQDEHTLFHPLSPYGVSKMCAFQLSEMYRARYHLFICNGILYNHESPLRSPQFVARKITLHVANYDPKKEEVLKLGNLDARRDWGFAGDYVEAMWLSLQQEKPDNYVIASGKTHSVREFVELAFERIGINVEWHSSGKEEIGLDKHTGKTVVAVDPAFFRPIDAKELIANPLKAQEILGWSAKMSLKELIKMMVECDKKALGNAQP